MSYSAISVTIILKRLIFIWKSLGEEYAQTFERLSNVVSLDTSQIPSSVLCRTNLSRDRRRMDRSSRKEIVNGQTEIHPATKSL